jgi:hypothetical protein
MEHSLLSNLVDLIAVIGGLLIAGRKLAGSITLMLILGRSKWVLELVEVPWK